MFRNTVLPIIVLVWGAAVALNVLVSGPSGDGAYASGQIAAGVFGIVMVTAATRHLLRARA